jgi:hypothetical protein
MRGDKLYKVTRTWYVQSKSCVTAIEDSTDELHDEVKSSLIRNRSKKVKMIVKGKYGKETNA